MSKIFMYAHGGSENHGCEAIVRSTYDMLDDLCQDEDRTQLRSEYVTDGVHFTLEGQKAVVEKLPVTL